MKLLIAEDEIDLAEALTAFFEKNQFTVEAVHNGTDAYDYAGNGAYDAVILDVMMPGMNGIEVLRRLREDGIHTPIMMLTAKAQKDDLRRMNCSPVSVPCFAARASSSLRCSPLGI